VSALITFVAIVGVRAWQVSRIAKNGDWSCEGASTIAKPVGDCGFDRCVRSWLPGRASVETDSSWYPLFRTVIFYAKIREQINEMSKRTSELINLQQETDAEQS
jgi:hypothetical protein